jgi:DNA-binding response OmpR family regulator
VRLLIVEDDDIVADAISRGLTAASYSVLRVASAEAAQAAIANEEFAMAVIDVGLPGIDGFEVARRLRRDPTNGSATLVAVTGYGQPSDRSAAMEAGFDTHIVKPVKIDELLRLLGPELTDS